MSDQPKSAGLFQPTAPEEARRTGPPVLVPVSIITEPPALEPEEPTGGAEQPAAERSAIDAPRAAESTPREPAPADVAASLTRIEKLLSEIRGSLDATARERGFEEFSILRMIGAVLQVFVVALVLFAAFDWMSRVPVADLAVKLWFAVVLQLMALTALRGGPRER
jgi:hypothetical protein